MHIFEQHKIVSVKLTDAGELEVVRQYPSNISYGNGQRAPDRVVKEIFKAVDGKIAFSASVLGKHTPAYMVAEQIEFKGQDEH